MITTITGAKAAVQSIAALRAGTWSVSAIQDYFPALARPAADQSSPPAVIVTTTAADAHVMTLFRISECLEQLACQRVTAFFVSRPEPSVAAARSERAVLR